MDGPLAIVFLGLLIFGAHLFNGLFKHTKVPNALILLIIGVLLGPVFKVIDPSDFGKVGPIFTTVTLIILMFESGINLKIGQLVKSIGSAFLLTVFNFLGSMAIAAGIAHLAVGLDLLSACFFGAIVGGTSSAIVIPIIKQLKMNEKGETVLLLESAISDVLCLVIGLALLGSMKEGEFDSGALANTIWKSFVFAALIGTFGGFVWSLILERMRLLKNHTFTNLAIVFVVYGATEYFGLNGGIATLCFGIALGNAYLFKNTWLKNVIPAAELNEGEKNFFGELVFILQTYFFVYVGICIKFGDPWIYLAGLGIVIGVILIRPFSIKLLVRGKMSLKDLSIMSVMTPKGLVPAILASIPLQLGLAGGEKIQDISYAVVIFSIILCSTLVIILSKDPLSIAYFRNMLQGKSTDARVVLTEEGEEVTVMGTPEEDENEEGDVAEDGNEEVEPVEGEEDDPQEPSKPKTGNDLQSWDDLEDTGDPKNPTV